MAKKKKANIDSHSDSQKIQEWLKTNNITQVAKNVCGNVEVKSFFRRKRKPQPKPAEKVYIKE